MIVRGFDVNIQDDGNPMERGVRRAEFQMPSAIDSELDSYTVIMSPYGDGWDVRVVAEHKNISDPDHAVGQATRDIFGDLDEQTLNAMVDEAEDNLNQRVMRAIGMTASVSKSGYDDFVGVSASADTIRLQARGCYNAVKDAISDAQEWNADSFRQDTDGIVRDMDPFGWDSSTDARLRDGIKTLMSFAIDFGREAQGNDGAAKDAIALSDALEALADKLDEYIDARDEDSMAKSTDFYTSANEATSSTAGQFGEQFKEPMKCCSSLYKSVSKNITDEGIKMDSRSNSIRKSHVKKDWDGHDDVEYDSRAQNDDLNYDQDARESAKRQLLSIFSKIDATKYQVADNFVAFSEAIRNLPSTEYFVNMTGYEMVNALKSYYNRLEDLKFGSPTLDLLAVNVSYAHEQAQNISDFGYGGVAPFKDASSRKSVGKSSVRKSDAWDGAGEDYFNRNEEGLDWSEIAALAPSAQMVGNFLGSLDLIWHLPSGNHPGIWVTTSHGPMASVTATYFDYPDEEGVLPKLQGLIQQGYAAADALNAGQGSMTKEQVYGMIAEMERIMSEAQATGKSVSKSNDFMHKKFNEQVNQLRGTRRH